VTTYIAGPMTGLPEFNYPAFHAAAAELRAAGETVISPAELNGPDTPDSYTAERTYEWYLRQALTALLRCHQIAMLPGWERSRGARLEHLIACELGMPVTYLTEDA
jgi:hypothetical protein